MKLYQKTTTRFKSLNEIVIALAEQMRPPERITVAMAAARYRKVNQPGAYVGPWLNETTPYMVEPMNTLASRKYSKMAFCGPAQCGKTDALIVNGIAYSVKVDPLDTMIFCPTSTAARDFSMRRIDRLHRHSPDVGQMLLKNRDADNKFDKHYITGMMLTLSYPSVTELAGRPVGRIMLTDFDRMDDDIGGDGNAFDLASKRTTTFNSFAMCCAESSPSRPIIDPHWIQQTPHQAPPCEGILGLYNLGDRRRWQWPCMHCDTYFEGKFEHLVWVDMAGKANMSNLQRAESVRLACPNCGAEIHPDDRTEMQMWGTWVPDFCRVNEKGQLIGERPRSDFASFWLRGTAAAFTTWKKLVLTYLDAKDQFDRTLSEETLKKFWNNDMGEPYVPVNQDNFRVPELLKARAEPLPERMVPEKVRFLVATVDVQATLFSVQVTGIAPGLPFDTYVIDRFEIIKSERTDEEGDPMPLKPPTYLEDWNLIEKLVMNREYELGDGSGRMMRVKVTACDSGGKAGSTDRAYDFYRKLKRENKHGRFVLVKGDPRAKMPRTQLTFPDTNRKDNKSAARGEIPVLLINSNLMKDALNARLDSIEPGRGMYHSAEWLPDEFFSELCAEVRNEKGWQNPNRVRNEAWDLSYYALAVCISPKMLAIENLDWENAPGWAKEWPENDLVREPQETPRFTARPSTGFDFSAIADELA